jgi:uncharacterized protein YggE
VTGVGTVSSPPDKAVLTLGASAVRGDVADALAAVNGKLEALIATLGGYGIEGGDIQTSDLSIWPEHNSKGVVEGFRVRNTIRVSTTNIDGLGEIIGSALAGLGDLAEMQGLSFEIDDRSAFEAQARTRAWADAREKARQLADLAGSRLGQAVEIIETGAHLPAPMRKGAMAIAAAESAPLEAGTATVKIQLTVRFSHFPAE